MSRDLCIMACVFCRDPLFQTWLGEQAGDRIDEAGAKSYILTACRIASRNELDTNQDAALRFHALVREPFLRWKEQQSPAGKDQFYAGELGEPWPDTTT